MALLRGYVWDATILMIVLKEVNVYKIIIIIKLW